MLPVRCAALEMVGPWAFSGEPAFVTVERQQVEESTSGFRVSARPYRRTRPSGAGSTDALLNLFQADRNGRRPHRLGCLCCDCSNLAQTTPESHPWSRDRGQSKVR